LCDGPGATLYDRLANGWMMPPGPWGLKDRTFSMRFSLKRDDVTATRNQ
jgi:hypothetical protein